MFTVQRIACLFLFLAGLQACSPLNRSYQSNLPALAKGDNKNQEDNTVFYRNEIPMRAVREVMLRFGVLENVHWEKLPAGGWLARYTTAMANNRINFNAAGAWTEILCNYTRPPTAIATIVTSNLNGYHLVSTSGIMFPSDNKNMLFSVVVAKAGNCKVLKVYKGNMTVFSDFEDVSMTTP